MSSSQLDISSDLSSGDPTQQTNAILAVIALQSAGRDTTVYTSQICQYILGNLNVPAPLKVKAYDVLKASILSDVDFARLLVAIPSDLRPSSPPEVHTAALGAIKLLPTHRLVTFLCDEDVIALLREELRNPSVHVRAAAAQAIAQAMTFEAMMKYLMENKNLKTMFENFVNRVAKMLVDKSKIVVVAACFALQTVLKSMSEKVKLASFTTSRHLKIGDQKSQHSQATALAILVCEDIALTIDDIYAEVLARFRSLPVDAKRETLEFVVFFLDTKVMLHSLSGLDHQPGEILGHQLDEAVYFFSECTASFDPSLVVEATRALLKLVKIDGKSAALHSQLPKAIQASIDSTNVLEGRYRHVAQQGLLSTFLSHMDALPSTQQADLFGKLPPMIATVPSSRQRLKAFVKLWSSMLVYEWRTNSTINSVLNTSIQAGAWGASDIQQVLLEKHMRDCIAGVLPPVEQTGIELEGVDPPHPRYRDPEFREEIVGSLLYVLATHPRPISGLSSSSALGATSANSALIVAVGIQAIGTALDWLQASKIALQNTKPCLGWDRVSGIQTTGTTACVDWWLQLLLRCINISAQLRSNLDLLPDNANISDKDKKSEDEQEEDASVESSGVDDIVPALKRSNSVLEGEFQSLLLQIASNWRALHPLVRPRAVWLCSCHLKLQSVLDSSWNALADALRGLLIEGEHLGTAGPARHLASLSEGNLRSKSSLSRSKNSYDAPVIAAMGETQEIGLLALERLSSLLERNHKGELRGRLSDISGMLHSLVSICMSRDQMTPGSSQRLARLDKLLTPIASSGRDDGGQGKDKKAGQISLTPSKAGTKIESEEPKKQVVVDLEDEETRGRSWASYPCTIPSAPSLMHSSSVQLYQSFLANLQSATLSDDAISSEVKRSAIDFGLPSLSTVVEALDSHEAYESVGKGPTWTQTTGVVSPVTLSFSHKVEPASSTIRLKCCLQNNTSQTIAGLEVQVLLGGPIAIHRRPLVFKISPLGCGSVYQWEIPCRCMTFGWPTVQAFLVIPVECPGFESYSFQSGMMRCKPYSISPLELIAKSSRPMYPAEFFQMWQTFSLRAQAYAIPKEKGIQGVIKVLGAIEEAGLVCASKVLVPVSGGVYAAYSGISWSGHTIACIVSSIPLTLKSTGNQDKTVLRLHFGSDVAEVISPMRGHENDLVAQLTKGQAIPVGTPTSMAGLESKNEGNQDPEEHESFTSTFSFFKSMISTHKEEEDKDEDKATKKKKEMEEEANNRLETYAMTHAALDTWKTLRQSTK